MKSTFSYLPSFWVKVLPVMLMLLCIGFTRMQAQNYKPFNEAVQAVSAAIDILKTEKNSSAVVDTKTYQANKVSAAPANSQFKVFELGYYIRFIENAKKNGEVALAVQAQDVDFAIMPGEPAQRSQPKVIARNDLMHLITY